MQTRTESVTVDDGVFDLHVWVPERGDGPGLLLIQEIYGVSTYIRGVAGKLAARGYVVAAPDLFWRIRPGWAAEHDEEGLRRSLDLASGFNPETGVADLSASLDRLRGLAEVTGETGVLGFCLGGTMAYRLAARRPELAVMVSFYGSGVPSALDLAGQITCPAQFHFGGTDPYIPRDQVAAVEQAVATMPNAEIHVQEDAGHAFHNWEAPMFHQPEAGERAWRLTERFLDRHLPA